MAVTCPGHVTAAESLGIAGHVHAGTAGTITRIEHFLQPESGNP